MSNDKRTILTWRARNPPDGPSVQLPEAAIETLIGAVIVPALLDRLLRSTGGTEQEQSRPAA